MQEKKKKDDNAITLDILVVWIHLFLSLFMVDLGCSNWEVNKVPIIVWGVRMDYEGLHQQIYNKTIIGKPL